MTDNTYTLCLSPGGKTRYAAGPYDKENQKPIYTIEIGVPSHVKHEVEVKQSLLQFADGYQWTYDLHNTSSWPAFIIIYKDGVPLPQSLDDRREE